MLMAPLDHNLKNNDRPYLVFSVFDLRADVGLAPQSSTKWPKGRVLKATPVRCSDRTGNSRAAIELAAA